MSQHVDLHRNEPDETRLTEDPEALRALAEAEARPAEEQRAAVAAVVARWPRCLAAWAALGDRARDDVEAYACYRVGYHRGLDRLRREGWRGRGFVRWDSEGNRGFLRALDGLRRSARTIGEDDEAQRCAEFLAQLDPSGPLAPANTDDGTTR